MAIPAQNIKGTIRSVGTYNSSGGYNVLKGLTNIAKSNSPVNNPPVLVGSDFAQIDLVANPTNLLTFTSLIHRTININYISNLTAQAGLIVVPPGASLQFVLSGVMSTPLITTITNLKIAQNMLSSGKYKMFQAQVDPSITSGTVYAQLYFQT